MLSRWLDRGLGQIVAPDENIAAVEQPAEASSSFWLTVAPDPVWEASQHGPGKELKRSSSAPPPSAFLYSPNQLKKLPTDVVCVHCGRTTPVSAKTPTGNTSALQMPNLFDDNADNDDELNNRVLSAAKGTAASMTSPPQTAELRNKVFRLCASSKPLGDKLAAKLKKILETDKSMLKERSSHLGTLVPDGFTPLMAAAYVNQVTAARIIIEIDDSTRQDVDMQGRTALHIAAENGALDISKLLADKDAPVDLMGRTPLGRAVTSVHKSAKRNQSQLQQVLFSPGDKSVCGKPSPYPKRQSGVSLLSAQYGHASMPGFRVLMEDAVGCDVLADGKSLLVSVCDGHGDNGQVSEFLVKKAPGILENKERENLEQCWMDACQELEETLKHSGLRGGSTALWAWIDETNIVVANVGDCRCILVRKPPEEDILAETMEKINIAEEAGQAEEEEEEEEKVDVPNQQEGEATTEEVAPPKQDEKPRPLPFVIKPLSDDHKPNLAEEKLRIGNAGLKVKAENFYDENAMKQTIHKIHLTDTEKMAVSRSFGDFEYKSNVTLDIKDQAVVATPDVEIHERDANRDLYLVLASDGVWDVMSNEDVGRFVYDKVNASIQADEPDVLPRIGDMLLNHCLEKGTRDNMSVVIVALHQASVQVEKSGALERRALKF